MLKVLLVDDEDIEIQALTLLINQYFEELEIVGIATDGLSAVNLAIEKEPDIIIMDIEMPIMTGIDAIKAILNKLYHIKILVISAHNDFTYAQDALKYGVSDYILKPLRKGEFINAVKDIVDSFQNDRDLLIEKDILKDRIKEITPLIEKDFIYHILTGNIISVEMKKYAQFLGWDLNSGYCMIIQFEKTYKKDSIYNTVFDKNIKKDVYEFIREYLKVKNIKFISDLYDDKLLFFISITNIYEEYEVRNWSMKIAIEICNQVKKEKKARLIVGIGQIYKDFDYFNQSYLEALNTIKVKNFNSYINHYSDLNYQEMNVLKYPVEKEKVLLDYILANDKKMANLILQELISWLFNRYYDNKGALKTRIYEFVGVLNRKICEQIIEERDIHLIYDNLINNISCVDNSEEFIFLRGVLQKYITQIINFLEEKKNNNCHYVIQKGVEYIHTNYMKDICLDKVCKYVGVSTYYFSRLFKEKLGSNFTQYLTEVRVKKAKELLKNTKGSVKEVAVDVGYNNQAYFGKIFKKLVGVTPSEYKNTF